jgi:hypothetical protein
MNNQPYGLDFMKALNILMPYQKQLTEIYDIYQNSSLTPVSKSHNAKLLCKELSKQILALDTYNDSGTNYDDIKKIHGAPPYRFDSHWELREVYIYLIRIFNNNDETMVINSVITGELLGVIECFLVRI